MRPVSLVLCTYGKWQYTSLCLYTALGQIYPDEVDEVIIFDTVPNAWNVDDTQNKLQEIQRRGYAGWPARKFAVTFFPDNLGSSITHNRAIEKCKPDNDVCVLTTDVIFGPHWLAPLRHLAHESPYAQDIAWVAPYVSPELCLDNIVNKEFRQAYFDQWYQSLIFESNPETIMTRVHQLYGGDFSQFSREFVKRNTGKIYDEIHGAVIYWKRETIQDIGIIDEDFSYFFDGRLGSFGGDDIDLYIRINNARKFRVTCFDSFVHHLVNGTNRKRAHDEPEKEGGDIVSGNRLLNKWEIDHEAEPLVFPGDVTGKKVPHKIFKPRAVPLQGDPLKLDWGLPGQIGLEYMVNAGREDVFPL